MARLVPAIHVPPIAKKNVDARDKPGHDEYADIRFVPARELPLPASGERE
jgi:hypothetical protein